MLPTNNDIKAQFVWGIVVPLVWSGIDVSRRTGAADLFACGGSMLFYIRSAPVIALDVRG